MSKKISINPSYIYVNEIDSNLTKKVLNFSKLLKFKKGFFRPNASADDFNIHKKSPVKEGAEIILDQMNHIIKEEGFDASNLMITNSQINCTKKNEYHTPHDHANCMLTCVWYLNNSNCETLFFRLNEWVDQKLYVNPMRPRGGSSGGSFDFRFLHWYDEEGKSLIKNFKPFIVHKQPTAANQVIIFPSSMLHMVSKNKSEENRYTFSMNVLPKKFGQKTNQVDFS